MLRYGSVDFCLRVSPERPCDVILNYASAPVLRLRTRSTHVQWQLRDIFGPACLQQTVFRNTGETCCSRAEVVTNFGVNLLHLQL